MSDDASRLTELEIALTHQQAMLDDLSAVVREQADRIDLLLRELTRLAARIEDQASDGAGALDANVRPPHW